MGYPAKSENDKYLQGTARNDRQTPDFVEPIPVETLPEPPTYLNKTGRKHWKKYTKLLQSGGILAETDLESLSLYCMQLQIAEKAAETLKDELFYPSVNENGETYYMGMTSVLKIFNEASAAAMKYGQQFGFTPSSRKGVPAPKKQKEGRLVKLMGGKRP